MAGSSIVRQIRIKLGELYIHKNEDNDDVVIGSGGYGNIYKATYLPKQETVALKKMISQGSVSERVKGLLYKEAQGLMLALGHENILQMFGIVMEKDHYGLVLEYMHFGSASEFLKDYKVLIALVLRISKHVISAMDYLHSRSPQVIHLDLKADNVLINNHCNAKVCDFGLAEWKHTSRTMTKKLHTQHEGRCGTLSHIAPEVLEDINCMATVYWDIYAFGITLWEIFAGKKPYAGHKSSLIKLNVQHGQRPALTDLRTDCPEAIRDMIQCCWDQTSSLRPQFKELELRMTPVYQQYECQLPDALQHVRQQVVSMHLPETELYECTKDLGADKNVHIHEAKGISDSETAKAKVTIPTTELTHGYMLTSAVTNTGNELKNQIRYIDMLHDMEHVIFHPNSFTDQTIEATIADNNIDKKATFKTDQKCNQVQEQIVSINKFNQNSNIKGQAAIYLEKLSLHNAEMCKGISQEEPELFLSNIRSDAATDLQQKLRDHDEHELRNDGNVLSNFEEMWTLQNSTSLQKTENLGVESHLSEPESIQHQTPESVAMETGSFRKKVGIDYRKKDYNDQQEMCSSAIMNVRNSSDETGNELSKFMENIQRMESHFNESRSLTESSLQGVCCANKSLAWETANSRVHTPFQHTLTIDALSNESGFNKSTPDGSSPERTDVSFNTTALAEVPRNPDEFQQPFPEQTHSASHLGGTQLQREMAAPMAPQQQKQGVNMAAHAVPHQHQQAVQMTAPVVPELLHDPMVPFRRQVVVSPVQQINYYHSPTETGNSSNVQFVVPVVKQSTNNQQLLSANRAHLQPSQLDGEQLLPVHSSHFQPSQSNANQNQLPTVVTSVGVKQCLKNLEVQQQLLQKSQVSNSDPVQNGEAISHKSAISSLGSSHPFKQESLLQHPLRSSMDHPVPQVVPRNGGKTFHDIPFPIAKSQNVPSDMPFPDARPKNVPITAPFPDARLSQSNDGINGKNTEKTRSTPSLSSLKKRSPPSLSSQMSETSYYNRAETDTVPVTPSRPDAPITISHKHAGGGLTAVTFRSSSGDSLPCIQIGNNNKMSVYNGYKKDKPTKSKKTTKPYKPSDLPKSECCLTADQMDAIAVEIGKDWRRLCRDLQLTEATIEQLHFDHFHEGGLYEITFQALRRWTEMKGKNATVKVMIESLWNINRSDIALKLADITKLEH